MIKSIVFLVLFSMLVCSIRMAPANVDKEQSKLKANEDSNSNSNGLLDEDRLMLESLLNEENEDDEESGDEDEDEQRYLIARSFANAAPRRIFIGRRGAADDFELSPSNEFISSLDKKNVRRHLFLGKRNSMQRGSPLQAKRNGQIHRIFIGKRGDIKRIFIGK